MTAVTGSGAKATLTLPAATKTARDAIMDSGMEAGLQDALDLLEEVAVSLR
jgi:hypothetical protein